MTIPIVMTPTQFYLAGTLVILALLALAYASYRGSRAMARKADQMAKDQGLSPSENRATKIVAYGGVVVIASYFIVKFLLPLLTGRH